MLHIGAGTRFSHYEIRSQLGAGGMGEVYLAEDTRLRRAVAIKFITRHKEISPAAEKRFLREARAASQLNHPNIITIYEAGETDNHAYIVMEYVEGQSLRELILGCDLKPQTTLDIALQISDALMEAHEHNVIHRDIKPENILFTERGRIKVLDFGLARNFSSLVTDQDGPTVVDSLTDSGAIVGTLPYMSPEQLRREPLDRRSDIFSFGIVLFEMLTGVHPFKGHNAFEIASLILNREEVRTDCFAPDVPPSVRALIARVLAKDRDRRFQTFAEVRRELETVLGDVLRGDVGLESFMPALRQARPLSGVNFRNSQFTTIATPAAPAAPPTVLVLPLEAVGSSPETSFIGIGLAYSITTGLAKIRDLSVLSKSASAGRGAQAESDTRAYARSLGANILLEGEVMRSGQSLRVMVRLSDVESGRVIWGDQYSGDESELFKIQDTVCESIASALRVRVSTDVRDRLAEPAAPLNIEAFELYSKGRAFIERYDIEENIDFAVQLFEESLKLDEEFALAYAGLSEAYWRKYQATREQAWVARAIAAGDRALVLDPRQAQVHVSLGIVYYGTGKTEQAIEEFKSAIDLQPVSDVAYSWLGHCYTRQGLVEEAVASYRKAIELRPGYWENYNRLGICYYSFGRYQDAIEQFRRVITIQPDNHDGYNNLGGLYCLLGRYDDAVAMHLKAIRIHPAGTLYSNLGTDYFYLERYAEAAEAYEKAIELKPGNDIYHRNLGDAYLRLDKKAEAQEQFEQARQLIAQQLTVEANNAPALGRLAIYQAKLGEREEASSSIERALALEPRNTTLMYQATAVYALTGDNVRAMGYLGRALEHGYSLAEAACDPDLEPLRDTSEYQSLISLHSQTGGV
ncbi:MAG: tetratricopeptide repeat protein [Acidobacteria bacterium]|nr:tetratricopeptide repeat protein [Acidobacteriota bacterium]